MKDKIRVFEIAQEVGTTSVEVIQKALKLGIVLKSPQSTVSFEIAENIVEYIATGTCSLALNIDELEIKKRLEFIKLAIELKENDIVLLQSIKLKRLNIKHNIKDIVYLVETDKLSEAIEKIDIFLDTKSNTTIVSYKDKEIEKLKKELKFLEQKLQNLSQIKQEYLNDIDEFNTLYNIKLGDIIQKILKAKEKNLQQELEEKEKKYKEIKNTIDDIKTTIDELEEILEQIDEDDENYTEVNQTYQDLKDELDILEKTLKE